MKIRMELGRKVYMKTKLIGICTVLALICGDCTGNTESTTLLNEISEFQIQDKETRYLNLINRLVSNNNQLRKSVKKLEERIKEQQKIIEKYKTAAEIYYDAKEYIEVPKSEYNKWIQASAEGDIKIIQAYINKRYDVNTQYDSIIQLGREYYLSDRSSLVRDFNALTVAAKYNRKEVIELLLKNKARINSIDPAGCTALMRACEKGNEDIVQTLINKGANVNLASIRGITPLMEAAANGHINIVEILIENGADVKAKSHNGLTALDFAETNKHKEIATILKRKEAETTEFLKYHSFNKKHHTSENKNAISIKTGRYSERTQTSAPEIALTTGRAVVSSVASAVGKVAALKAAQAIAKKTNRDKTRFRQKNLP